MIHRFVELDEVVPDIPILAKDNDYTIWQIGNLATPRAISATSVTVASGDFLADPQASPVVDGSGIPTEFVYCRVRAGTGGDNEVNVSSWDGSSITTIATSPSNVGTTGKDISLQPSWSIDGTKLLYRDSVFDGVTNLDFQSIHIVDSDGSNDTILYTVPNDNYVPFYPSFSYDGTKIAWVESEDTGGAILNWRLYVMDADGTNQTLLVGPLGPSQRIRPRFAWANTSLTIAYQTLESGAATADQTWKKIDADGTNGADIWVIDRSGRTTLDYDSEPIRWSWLSDDSAIAAAIADFGGTGLGDLVLLDPAGTGPTTLIASAQTNTTGEDYRPVAINGRIYFPTDDTPATKIDSVLEDGTDRRTDLDGSDFSPTTRFQGFQGDNIN